MLSESGSAIILVPGHGVGPPDGGEEVDVTILVDVAGKGIVSGGGVGINNLLGEVLLPVIFMPGDLVVAGAVAVGPGIFVPVAVAVGVGEGVRVGVGGWGVALLPVPLLSKGKKELTSAGSSAKLAGTPLRSAGHS